MLTMAIALMAASFFQTPDDGDYKSLETTWKFFYPTGDSDEADRHSELIAITVPGWIRSVVGAKRRWRMDFPESDRDRQACC